MDKFIELCNTLNASTLFGMGIMLWYFTREIRKEIREDINSIRQETAAQSARSDKLYEVFQEGLASSRREIEIQSNRWAELNEKWAAISKENSEKWAESNAKWAEMKIETNELRRQAIKN